MGSEGQGDDDDSASLHERIVATRESEMNDIGLRGLFMRGRVCLTLNCVEVGREG